MNEQYEIIEFDATAPMRLTLYETTAISKHCHNEIELIMVLRGSVKLFDGERITRLLKDDIALINRNFLHELISDEIFTLISLKINPEKANIYLNDKYFVCNSSEDNNKGKYYSIKHYLAQIIKVNSSESNNSTYLNRSLMYALVFNLCENFAKDPINRKINSDKYLTRLNRIVAYIDGHYNEGLTLQSLAKSEHLSTSYLSQFFEKYFGINFLTYYNEVRLSRAVNELLSSDESIEVIAANNGFFNTRSFLNLFKKKFKTIPSLYRKKYKENTPNKKIKKVYFDKDDCTATPLGLLAKYLPPEPEDETISSFQDTVSPPPKTVRVEKISYLNSKKILKHYFKTLACVGRAKEILYADIQAMIKELQSDIGFEYINFHGLLSDDMLVYSENSGGTPKYSFVHLDKVMDFLLSVNLKPFINFGFMPHDLALAPTRKIFANKFILSPPKDYQKWSDLIKSVVIHLIERYGLKTVKTWLFSVWNEPDTCSTFFGFNKPEDFFKLYKITFDTVKSINKNLILGSPSLLMKQSLNSQQWHLNFIEFCKTNDCMPDFMNLHFYDNDFSDTKKIAFSDETLLIPNLKLNRDENSFKKTSSKIFLMLKEMGLSKLPVYLTEWNLTVSHRNLLNDTCFKSCYLVKNLLENYDLFNSFGYWTLSDFIEETYLPTNIFHGGLGLFTYNGIKKPHYYALVFLNRLGKHLIKQGPGYFITKSNGKMQIILYNYEHFNYLFASGETFDMTFAERYTPFSKLGKMDILLEITDIPAKKSIIREYIINQQNGSAFDIWIKMQLKKLENRDVEYIKKFSAPNFLLREEFIKNEALIINTLLDPLEVRLIEIDFT